MATIVLDDIARRLSAVLTERVTVEHPGCIVVRHCANCELRYWFGTANGTWQGDLQDAHGRYMGETLDTGQTNTASEVAVTRAIVLALDRSNPMAHRLTPKAPRSFTRGQVADIISRARVVITTSDEDALDGHHELLTELADVELLARSGEPEDPALDIERADGTTPRDDMPLFHCGWATCAVFGTPTTLRVCNACGFQTVPHFPQQLALNDQTPAWSQFAIQFLDSTDNGTFEAALLPFVGRAHGGTFGVSDTMWGYLLRFTTAYGVFDGYIVETNLIVSGDGTECGFVVHCTDTEGNPLPEGHPDRYAYVRYVDLKAIGIY